MNEGSLVRKVSGVAVAPSIRHCYKNTKIRKVQKMDKEEKEKVLTSLLRSLATSKDLINEQDENSTLRCVFAYAAGYLKNSKIPYRDVYEFLSGWVKGYFKGNIITAQKEGTKNG